VDEGKTVLAVWESETDSAQTVSDGKRKRIRTRMEHGFRGSRDRRRERRTNGLPREVRRSC